MLKSVRRRRKSPSENIEGGKKKPHVQVRGPARIPAEKRGRTDKRGGGVTLWGTL
jgi:hypothetical protein